MKVAKLLIISILIFFVIIQIAYAVLTNLIQNPGFETSSNWTTETSNGGSAQVQDSSVRRSGTYSAKTDTTGCNGLCYAKVRQTLLSTKVSKIPNQAGTLVVWLYNRGSASDGYVVVEVVIGSSQGRYLHYRWRLDGSALPSDNSTDKYIDMGTSLTLNTWVQFSRNLYSDWVTTKGMPATDTINLISLDNYGSYTIRTIPLIETSEAYRGQIVNFDDTALYYDGTPPTITFVSPTPANNKIQKQNWVYVNVTVVDGETNISNCILEWNGSNLSMTKVGTGTSVSCYRNVTGISDGVYNYKVYANDSANNWGVSETRKITIDTQAPTITFVSPTPDNETIQNQTWVYVNVTVNDTLTNISICLLEWNGNNETMSKGMEGTDVYCYLNKTWVPGGVYNYKVYANDSANNWGVSETRTITIFENTSIQEFEINRSWANRGDWIKIKARLLRGNGSYIENEIIYFYDQTKGILLGYNTTNSSGYATIDYQIPSDEDLGIHTINATYLGNETKYFLPSNSTTSISIHSIPSIQNISVNPSLIGFGYEVNITSYLYDEDGDEIQNATVRLTYPNSTQTEIFCLNGSYCNLTFNNTWEVGIYNFTIWVKDSTNTTNESSVYNFEVNVSAKFVFSVEKEEYGSDQNVRLTNYTWWNVLWPFRKNITINNTQNPENLTDYQVSINITYNSNMQSDFDDLRFTYYNETSNTETEIPYWIESKNDNNWAYVWVRIPFIKANNYTTIFAYYGNPDAATKSNGTAVFDFFDDFESYADGSDINNQGGWTTKRIGGTGEAKVRIYNGRKHLHLNSSDGGTIVVHSASINNSGYALRLYEVADDWNEAIIMAFTDGYISPPGRPNNGYEVVWWGWTGTTSKIRKWVNNASTDLVSISDSDSNGIYHLLEFVWVGNSLMAYRNGSLKMSANDNTFTSKTYIHLGEWEGSSRYIDWVLLRKYSSPSPTTNIGSEQNINQTSRIYNLGSNPFKGYLRMKIQRNVSNSWVDVESVVDDLSNDIIRNISDYLNIYEIFDHWSTDAHPTGDYRVYGELVSPYGNVLKAYGSELKDLNYSSNFKIFQVDIKVNQISFNNTSPKENEIIKVSANVSNEGNEDAINVSIQLKISLWNGTSWNYKSQSTQKVNISAHNSTLVNFTWTAKPGTWLFNVTADPDNEINEYNETNNNNFTNYTVPAWHIFYGNVNTSLILADFQIKNFTLWIQSTPKATIYFLDKDSLFNPINLYPLNGTNDLEEADIALNMTGFNDSIKELYDKNNDGLPDAYDCFIVNGNELCNIPIINSTENNNGNFVTGILWISDNGNEYNGTQDLVFASKINGTKTGSYGEYEYEIRIPAYLRSLKGSEDVVSIYIEVVND